MSLQSGSLGLCSPCDQQSQQVSICVLTDISANHLFAKNCVQGEPDNLVAILHFSLANIFYSSQIDRGSQGVCPNSDLFVVAWITCFVSGSQFVAITLTNG